MPLLVNLRHLKDKAVDLNGELPVEDLDLCLRDDSVQARHPLQHNLEVQLFGQSVLVQGELKILLDCQCVRCLKPVPFPLELPNWAVHLALEGEEKVPVVSD